MSGAIGNLDAGDDMRSGAAHQVRLEPSPFAHYPAPFGVVPALEPTGREAAGIDGELRLDALQRAGALFDHGLQDRREQRVFQVVERAVVVRRPGDVALGLAVVQVAHGAPARDTGIDLEHGAEHHVRKRQSRAALALWRLDDALAEAVKQLRKASGLVGLCGVVGGPVLAVGNPGRLDGLDRLGDGPGGPTVAIDGFLGAGRLAAKGEFDRPNVLALGLP